MLPAAFLVLGVTLFASRYLAPETDWIRTAHEAIASAFYVENWLLVQQATDYLAPVDSPTPVQHYWSLAVEEQFYLVWPLLLVVATVLAGRRVAVRSMARVIIAVVLVLSLAYSLHQTAADPTSAYFMTTTRIWQLAAGGLLATWIPPVTMPLTRTVGAWGGLAMIGVAALVFDTGTPWPGTGALLPIGGAVLFIWSACGERYSPGFVLGSRSAQWLGDASYSVYLWHWPLLVLAPLALDRELLAVDKIVIVGLTLGLAWFTVEYVENRWRVPHPATPASRSFQMAGVGALGVIIIAAAQIVGVRLTEQSIAATTGDVEVLRCYGAAAMAQGPATCPESESLEITPPPTSAMDDRPSSFSDGCMIRRPYPKPLTCTVGTGSTQVALVGNSHAAQFLPALEEIADIAGPDHHHLPHHGVRHCRCAVGLPARVRLGRVRAVARLHAEAHGRRCLRPGDHGAVQRLPGEGLLRGGHVPAVGRRHAVVPALLERRRHSGARPARHPVPAGDHPGHPRLRHGEPRSTPTRARASAPSGSSRTPSSRPPVVCPASGWGT